MDIPLTKKKALVKPRNLLILVAIVSGLLGLIVGTYLLASVTLAIFK